ncbi:MAG: hypothetical protein KUG79_12110 [Pseudomonadales bacterium]|nr:hypothetical protein [Pseudomonadales bacterium]
MAIEIEDAPKPVVKMFANKLRQASTGANFDKIARKITGRFALQSTNSYSSITISISDDKLRIQSGIKKTVKIILYADFYMRGVISHSHDSIPQELVPASDNIVVFVSGKSPHLLAIFSGHTIITLGEL